MKAMIGKFECIFDDKVNVAHTNTDFGCVHPDNPDFYTQLNRILTTTRLKRVLAPKLSFNTKVTPIDSLDQLVLGHGMTNREKKPVPNFHRTLEASDGVIVSITGETRLKIGVMIMNADCGVTKILAPNGEMAVLHTGLDNVDSPIGANSIISNAIKYFIEQGIEPKDLQMRVGEAAQSCCYGIKNEERIDKLMRLYRFDNEERIDKLMRLYGFDVVKKIKNPPRKDDHIGMDIPLIAVRQADGLGVQDIVVENLCTSCYGLAPDKMNKPDEFGTWFSNLREDKEIIKKRGYGLRNAVIVFPCEK